VSFVLDHKPDFKFHLRFALVISNRIIFPNTCPVQRSISSICFQVHCRRWHWGNKKGLQRVSQNSF